MEGFVHTRSVKRYAGKLLLFAVLSEIPWNLTHSGNFLYGGQNVMFTLLFGLLGLWVIRDFQGDPQKQSAFLLGLLALSVVFRADYGCAGFGFIRSKPLKYAFYLIYPLHLLILFWIRKKTVGF